MQQQKIFAEKSDILFFYSETNDNFEKTKGSSFSWIFDGDLEKNR